VNYRALPPLLALLLAAETLAADSLSVTAAIANATVRPAVDGQIRLPALEIATRIRGSCSDGGEPRSLSISSADSVQLVGLDTAGDDGSWNTVFSLPANQVPPLVARGFCLADTATVEQFRLRKEAFVSLRVSLRCADGETERLTTRTALVDIDLVCEADVGAASQESSE
jgi:hypothetical protein